ncbi:MAG: choice-of-anchor A family protein, partial [Methanosarcinaceae archaeon]|nr:choice-of-anchor A family protein [Methanosarcinaceae archaeon]
MLLIIGTLLLTVPAAADTNPFRIAGDYNGFILGDVTQIGGLSEGALALKGDSDLRNNVSIGTLLPPGGNSMGMGMVVGGNSTWVKMAGSSGQVIEGDMHVGGIIFHEEVSILNGTLCGPLCGPNYPINFTAEEEYLKSLSAYWANLSATPGTTVVATGIGATRKLNLTGSNLTLNIFHVNFTQWDDRRQVNLTIPPNSSVIINVDGI